MGSSSGRLEGVEFVLADGTCLRTSYQSGAGLGFVPWPGTFALASYLDRNANRLNLHEVSSLELGSGSCTISGLAAGKLCRWTTLTDRSEVITTLARTVRDNDLLDTKVAVKVLDWVDLDFTMSSFSSEAIDVILMTEVVYYDMLWRPLLHTLLLLCESKTLVFWANCDTYPHFTPNVEGFLKLLDPFFQVHIEETVPQRVCESPHSLPNGQVTIRLLTLKDKDQAMEAVDLALARDCARRCFR